MEIRYVGHMENWKTIKDHPAYEVSDMGRIRRGDKIIKPWKQGKYLKVSFSEKGKVSKDYIHRIVAKTFNYSIKIDGLDVAHNNGNSMDNRAINLRWATRSENMADCIKHGTSPRGERNGHAKVTAEDVLEMRKRRSNGETFDSISASYPICRQSVQDAVYGINWSHV